MSKFSSSFKEDLEGFVAQKRAVGFPYDTAERILSVFDRFCLEHYPDECLLGMDMAMHWAQKRPGEHVNTLTRRITPVRQFAKYLLSIGIDAYVIPDGIPAKSVRYVPHVLHQRRTEVFFLGARPDYLQREFSYSPSGCSGHLSLALLLWPTFIRSHRAESTKRGSYYRNPEHLGVKRTQGQNRDDEPRRSSPLSDLSSKSQWDMAREDLFLSKPSWGSV